MSPDNKVTAACVAFVAVGAALTLGWPLLGTGSTGTLKAIAAAAVGPFLGAGLVFVSAISVQSLKKQREDLCAGNLALLTIAAQYNEFLNYRSGLRKQIALRAEGMRGYPAWTLAPVLTTSFSARTLNFDSLAFLFDRRDGVEVHEDLLMADQHYESLRILGERLSTNVQEVQAVLAPIATKVPPPTPTELGAMVAFDLRVRTLDILKLVVDETEQEPFYLRAFDRLRAVLAARFGEERVPKSIEAIPGRASADLPPLPQTLRLP